MKIVENWREVFQHYSSLALTFIAAFPAIWAASPEVQAILPATWVLRITAAAAIIGFIGKFIDQPGLEK